MGKQPGELYRGRKVPACLEAWKGGRSRGLELDVKVVSDTGGVRAMEAASKGAVAEAADSGVGQQEES